MLGLFTALLLAHVLGDFVFQSSKWVAHKEANKQKSKYLYIHIAIHGACTLGLLLLLQSSFLWITIPIVISHYLIDLGKLHIQNKSNAKMPIEGKIIGKDYDHTMITDVFDAPSTQ